MDNFKSIHVVKKLARKEINFKLCYLMLLIVISFLSMITYYSYAIFTVNKEKSGALSIIRNNLNFQLSGEKLSNDSLTVPKNTKTYIKINIKNLNSIKVKYVLCYNNDLNSNVSINYYLGTNNLPTGQINDYLDDNNNVDVILVINNKTDEDTTITFKVVGGLPNYELVIPADFSTINKGIGASGNIKDTVLNEEINNYSFDNNDNEYIYIKGNNSNNYLWYSGKLWRIIGVNKNNKSVKLIADDIISSIYYHSNSSSIGFSSSYAYNFLNNDFYDSLRNPTSFLVDTVFNATKIDNNNKPSNSNLVTTKVGLLSRYEYSKLTYLGIKKNFWLINPTTNNLGTYVDDNNAISSTSATSGFGIRPVISLKSNLNIIDGIGSKTNPYKLENDNDLAKDLKGKKLNTRYSGEYVKFNNQLFRIVNVVSNNTKIISVNTIGDPIKFSSSETNNLYNKESNPYNYLNNDWYNSLSLFEKDMIIESSFNAGLVGVGESYTNSSNSTVNVKIGLPSVGELFTGYVGLDNKAYFTMNPSNSNKVNCIDSNGTLSNSLVTSGEYKIKASLYLKDNVVIVSGNGTINNPFVFSEESKEVTSNTPLSTILEDVTHLGLSGRYLNMENEKFIVGENPNNYLWYSDRLWRAVSIITKVIGEENQYIKKVKLITDESVTELSYHKENSSDFDTSYAYNYLNFNFYNTLSNPTYYLDTSYSYNAALSVNNNNPPNTTMNNCKVGLLNRYEYSKLTTNVEPSKNYLNINSSWWLLTPYNTNDVNYVTSIGEIDNSKSTNIKGIRPTIVLKGDLLIVSGSGSRTNPYLLIGNNENN